MCPGARLAQREIFLVVSNVLHGFEIRKGSGMAPNELASPVQDEGSSVVRPPAPTPLQVTSRPGRDQAVMKGWTTEVV